MEIMENVIKPDRVRIRLFFIESGMSCPIDTKTITLKNTTMEEVIDMLSEAIDKKKLKRGNEK